MVKPRKTFNSWRSSLEDDVAKNLAARGAGFRYEERKIKYTPLPKEHTYTPDFELDNGVIIEVKGYLTTQDRQKMRCVKEQHPELDIRFLFGRSQNRINKGSPTTYSMWAEKHGFKWCEKVVPEDWINEPRRP